MTMSIYMNHYQSNPLAEHDSPVIHTHEQAVRCVWRRRPFRRAMAPVSDTEAIHQADYGGGHFHELHQIEATGI
jgi:hypothetical protein